MANGDNEDTQLMEWTTYCTSS